MTEEPTPDDLFCPDCDSPVLVTRDGKRVCLNPDCTYFD